MIPASAMRAALTPAAKTTGSRRHPASALAGSPSAAPLAGGPLVVLVFALLFFFFFVFREPEVWDAAGGAVRDDAPPPPPSPPGLLDGSDAAAAVGVVDDEEEARRSLHSFLWPARQATSWHDRPQYARCRHPVHSCSVWVVARVPQWPHRSISPSLSSTLAEPEEVSRGGWGGACRSCWSPMAGVGVS